jgi:hypothetical protein
MNWWTRLSPLAKGLSIVALVVLFTLIAVASVQNR